MLRTHTRGSVVVLFRFLSDALIPIVSQEKMNDDSSRVQVSSVVGIDEFEDVIDNNEDKVCMNSSQYLYIYIYGTRSERT